MWCFLRVHVKYVQLQNPIVEASCVEASCVEASSWVFNLPLYTTDIGPTLSLSQFGWLGIKHLRPTKFLIIPYSKMFNT